MSFRTAFLEASRASTAIDRLREQRKPTVTTTPRKPKPVTDEQLLAVVEQLQEELAYHRRLIDLNDKDAQKTAHRLERFWFGGVFTRLFGTKWWTDA